MLPLSSKANAIQQRSLSTNIPLVHHEIPIPLNIPITSTSNQSNAGKNNKMTISISSSSSPMSSSFNRTASKKRREFGKEKKNVSSNIEKVSSPTDEQPPNIHQVVKKKSVPFNDVISYSIINCLPCRKSAEHQVLHRLCKFVIRIFAVLNLMNQEICLFKMIQVSF